MKTVIISTSPRKNSNSIRVANYLKSVLREEGGSDASIVSFEEVDIPMVGRGDLEKDNLTSFQHQLVRTWGEADLVFFVVPEYNWSTSGELINALHQLGSDDFGQLFENKVFAFVGVSSGRGGRRPCLEIGIMVNKLISFLNKVSVVSPKLFESHESGKNVDETGRSVGNSVYEKGVRDFVHYTLKIAHRWFR